MEWYPIPMDTVHVFAPFAEETGERNFFGEEGTGKKRAKKFGSLLNKIAEAGRKIN